MSIQFNADEVFEMAEQIEKKGKEFYEKAAEMETNSKNKEMLLDLARMEEGHMAIFAKMREELSGKEKESTTYDPDDQIKMYINAFVEGKIFDKDSDPTEFLKEARGLREIVKKAIELEKNSVVFYIGIKKMTPDHLGKEKVDNILEEEVDHIATLVDILDMV